MLPLQKITYSLALACLFVCLMFFGKVLLVPVVLSFVLWYLINAVDQLIRRIPAIGSESPRGVSLTVAAGLVLAAIVLAGSLVGRQINEMIATAPEYWLNLERQFDRILVGLGYDEAITLRAVYGELDINGYLLSLLTSFTTVTRQFLLVLLYTLFLLVEQHTFTRKLAALGLNQQRKVRVLGMLDKINRAIRAYVGVKFAASFATALLSFFVIEYAGVDFAIFWAFAIFALNFIPTIGSIVATILPSLMALVQFDYLTPFVIVVIGVGLIQLSIGGLLEPRLYGNALNISPFVIIFSLILWGLLWGIVGMLLCVPITFVLITFLAQFRSTRPIAVLLSRRGKV
ncbi:putative PurR-regulated permease PerM [Lewinella aquimaris]|uniref:Putative PurR-regulated permease PerM n=1 Tax=Neolewinella aquimaris TaxID=1835722 RepID=A0A840E8C1_9BACT|nr:AI-2E family transporter [Neolewinella aquimaris]MBB4079557.1 putative PurR-regulated permease PerM [Neolewinella aquimaris]